MSKAKFFGIIILFSVIFIGNAQAADVWEKAQSSQYGTKAGGMLGRGFINAATCPADLIMQTVDKTIEGPPVIGTLTGIGSGAGCTIVRASSGIIDVLTFWIPNFNGFKVSKNYSNCLEEDFVQNNITPTNYSNSQWLAPQGESSYVSQPQTFASEATPASNLQYVKGAPQNNNLQYVKGAPQSAYSGSGTMSSEQRMQYVK